MLYEEHMGKIQVVTSMGDNIGKVVDFGIDLNDWLIKYFIVSHGTFKKNVMYARDDIKEVDEDKKRIVIDSEAEKMELPDTKKKECYLGKNLVGMKVLSSDGEKVGKVSNFEVPTKLKTLKVWKVMIKTGFTSRRLRISANEITEVGQEVMMNKTLEEIFPKEEEEE